MSTVISIPKMPVWIFIGLFLAFFYISGITGDVPDGVVYTDLHQNALLGSRAVLKCEFYRTPIAVYWKKGDNPSTSPNLITWAEGEPNSGSCVKDKTCNMGNDYSLIIKNVSIADQGRYICRVSNYKGILIHNLTDVKVLALPEEPFPIINECKESHGQNCILLVTGPVNITCTVLKYFPNVDLFFLHGIQKYSIKETVEWTNTDGTKSKSISTTASPSEIPYGCVAFNIPGSQEQRTATVTVTGQSDVTVVTTTPSSRSPLLSVTDGPIERNKYIVIKIVPITTAFCVVTGIILFFTIYRRRQRRRESKNDGEAMPMVPKMKIDGKISYYELWCLVRHLLYDTAVLRDTLRELRKADIKENLSEQEGYEMLCTWKDNNRSGNEGGILNKALKEVLEKEDYDRARDFFCANRKNSSMKSYQHALEHILCNITDLKKIKEFLSELIPGRPTSVVNDSVSVDTRESALRELTSWSNGHLNLNPLVLLSLALERAGCRSVAKEFFLIEKLPEELTSPIETKAIKEIVQKLTGRHCKRLMREEISNDELRSIIAENNEFLFDTNSMIADCLGKLTCSDYEKRRRFDDTIVKSGRYDLLDYFGTMSHRPCAVHFMERLQSQKNLFDHETIYDDDIPQLVKLVKCLPLEKISEFNKKTGLSADRHGSNLEADLRKRRDDILTRSTSRKASSQEFRSLRLELTKHTENIDSTVTDEEIEVVASQVTAAGKQQELLGCLGIEVDARQKRQRSFVDMVDHLKEWQKTQTNRLIGLQDSLRHIGFGDSSLTDEEIEVVASRATSFAKQQLLRRLGKETDAQQKTTFAKKLKEWQNTQKKKNCRESFYQSLKKIGLSDYSLTDGEIEVVASRVTSPEKQQEVLIHLDFTLTDGEIAVVASRASATAKQQLLRRLGIETYAQQKNTFVNQLKEWRNFQTTKYCREVFYKSFKETGVTDFSLTYGEIAVVASRVTSPEKQEEMLRRLGYIKTDAHQKATFANQLTEWRNTQTTQNCREVFYRSLIKTGFIDFTLSDGEIAVVASRATPTAKQQVLRRLGIETDAQQNTTFVNELKEWRNSQTTKNCREVFYKSFKETGVIDFSLTEGEIAVVASRVTSPEKQEEMLRRLGYIKTGAHQKNTFVNQLTEWRNTQTTQNCREVFYRSLIETGFIDFTLSDGEIDVVASRATPTSKQQVLRRLSIETDAQQKSTFANELKEWRNTQTTKNCREAFSKSLKETGVIDFTLTDEKIEVVASRATSTAQQQLLRRLAEETDAQQKNTFAKQLKEWRNTQTSKNCREVFYKSLKETGFTDFTLTDGEIEVVASRANPFAKQQLLRRLGIETDAQQKTTFANQLKEWRKTQTTQNCREAFYTTLKETGFIDFFLTYKETGSETKSRKPGISRRLLLLNKCIEWLRTDGKMNCRKVLQESLGVIGLRECIVSKITKTSVYQVELCSIALNLLMEDVRPMIEALAIDSSTASSYIQPVSKQNKGTKRLILELIRSHASSETNRHKFSKALQCIGFVDVSRSVYFDFEPSVSELINILDCVGQGYVHDIDRFLERLDLGADDIEECRDSEGQIDKMKLMRVWKRQIRPVPYHYRLEIATALRDAGLNGVAKGILSGEYRRKRLNPHVLRGISSRLGDVGITKLCALLKLGQVSTSRSLKASATMVTTWVNEWMNKYDPSDTGVRSGHMRERKSMNDEIYSSGFCELAEEISALENCQQLDH